MPFSEQLPLPKVTVLRTLLLSVGRHNQSLSGWLSAEFIASKNTITFWAASNFLLVSRCHFSARCFVSCGFFSLARARLFYHGSGAVMWCSCCCGDVEIVECTSVFLTKMKTEQQEYYLSLNKRTESAHQASLCVRNGILMLSLIIFVVLTVSTPSSDGAKDPIRFSTATETCVVR